MMTQGFMELSQIYKGAPFASLGRHLQGLNFGAGHVANLRRNFRARLQRFAKCADGSVAVH